MSRSGNILRKILKVILTSFAVVLFLILSIFLVLKSSRVQTFLTEKLSVYLSQQYGTVVKTGKVDISLLRGVILDDLYIEDQKKDTLVYIKSLGVFPKGFPRSVSKLNFKQISAEGTYLNLYQLPDSSLNMQFLLDSLAGDETTNDSGMFINCNELKITNSRFAYKQLQPDTVTGINFGDILLTNLNFTVSDFELDNNLFSLNAATLSLKEKSGFELSDLFLKEAAFDTEGISAKAFQLNTPGSYLGIRKFSMLFETWESFSYFEDSVFIEATFSDSSLVQASDMNAFFEVPVLGFEDIALGGKLSGTLNQMKVRSFKFRLGSILRFNMQSNINHITTIDSVRFDVIIDNFRLNTNELAKLKFANSDKPIVLLPDEISGIRMIDFTGEATGNLNDFRMAGKFESPAGNATLRVSGGRSEQIAHFVKGYIQTEQIDLSQILNNSSFGKLNMTQNFDFSLSRNNDIQLETNGIIDSIDYNNYRYRNITNYVRLHDAHIDSFSVKVKEKNLDFLASGSANFSTSTPHYNANIEANHINLNALNLYNEKHPAYLSTQITANFSGSKLDDFVGNINLQKPLILVLDTIEGQLNEFSISAEISSYEQGEPVKKYRINSDFADAEMTTKGGIEGVYAGIMNVIGKYLPVFAPKNYIVPEEQHLRAEITGFSKNMDFLLKFAESDILISENTFINSYFDSFSDAFDFTIHSPGIKTKDVSIQNLFVKAENKQDHILLTSHTAELNAGEQINIKDIQLNSRVQNDTVNFNILWNNKADTLNTRADIKGNIAFEDVHNDSSLIIKALLNESAIIIEGKTWLLSETQVMSDSTYIQIQGLKFSNNNQKITVNGDIAENSEAELRIGFTDFQLNNLNSLMPEGYLAEGQMNGNFRLRQLYSDILVLSNDTIKNLSLNNISLGDMYLFSDWNSSMSAINFSFYNMYGDPDLGQRVQVTDSVFGTYWPGNDSIFVKGNFTGFNIRTFSPLYRDYVNFMRGSQLTGYFMLNGYLKNPQLQGELALIITGIGINYPETSYSVNESLNLKFNNREIIIDSTKLYSRGGGDALLYGNIKHQDFDKFDFNINLTTNKFQFLNTQATDTSFFYGTAYGSGLITVKGAQENLVLDINLKTDNNTSLFIPMSSGETLSEEQSFMTFVSRDENGNEQNQNDPAAQSHETQSQNMSDITINMNLSVTPGTEIQLIMDEQTGDIIKARGNGNLRIGMNTAGDFTMFGDYTISRGEYLFTLQNFFSKHFTIKQGGTILWSGEPEDADIDLTAVYSLQRVGVHSLLLDPEMQNAKTNVNCVIDMKGNLNTPDIRFRVELPNDEYRISQHLNALEQDEINEQFLSLLLIGSFQPLPGLSQQAATGSPVKIGELVSNQLNRRLAGITRDVDVGVNYQTGSELTTDELALELSTRLWDDRITIGGNLGVGGSLRDADDDTQTENIIGEVEVNVKLNPQGTIQLKAYSKPNDTHSYDRGIHTQGLGFFWRREFDKMQIFKKDNSKNSKQDSQNDSLPKPNKNPAVKPQSHEEQ